jgi:Fe-S cluster assembly protein SufD
MKEVIKETAVQLKQEVYKQYYLNINEITKNDSYLVRRKRDEGMRIFAHTGFPSHKNESWKHTRLDKVLNKDFHFTFNPPKNDIDVDQIFKCDIYDFNTDLYLIWNGWLATRNEGLKTLENGVRIGSIHAAIKELPELFEQHYGKYADILKNPLTALNQSMFTDGLFIYVPDNVEHPETIQLVHVMDTDKDLYTSARNMVILGKNSKLRMVQCDDSVEYKNSFINNVNEVFMDEGAKFEYYKMQNKDDQAIVMNQTYIHQEANSQLTANNITLNGGFTRNDVHVKLNGRGADTQLNGVYLMDGDQFVDNHLFVDHAVPDCTSNQLYKGIVDDDATAVFNGYVLVQKDAQRTNAFQNNNNIQLTDGAHIHTQPFLEIYADDVKCSHGATVGQLDEDAMFYMKQRGICDRNAKQLLMMSFIGDATSNIHIDQLKDRVDDLVRRRLAGELSACEQCSLTCTDPNKPISFEIDMTKV